MHHDIDALLAEIRACRYCSNELPLGPHPVLIARPNARLLIIGQAPGTRVHWTGIPWNDPSGERLRGWLGIEKSVFYNPDCVAIMPMGFCYPGAVPRGGDAPPRPECAPMWHERLRAFMPNIELTVLAGMYAQKYYLGKKRAKTLTETVKAWRDYGPNFFPIPHPSWRSTVLVRSNPWFEHELLPDLRARVNGVIWKC